MIYLTIIFSNINMDLINTNSIEESVEESIIKNENIELEYKYKYKYEILEKQNKLLINSVEELTNSNEIRDKTINTLNYENDNLKNENDNLKNENENENDNLKNENDNLKNELDISKFTINEQKTAIDSLVDTNNLLNGVIGEYSLNEKKYWVLNIPKLF